MSSNNIKKIVNKLLVEQLKQQDVEEEYPPTFVKDDFYKLRNFTSRIRYCTQHLQKLAQGSSRIVFKIDDQLALKLAKNSKGIAQNTEEGSIGQDYYFDHIVAKVFKVGDNDEWIESELATKLKPTRFKQLTGVDIKDVNYYLRNEESENHGGKPLVHIDPKEKTILDNNEFVAHVRELMLNYGLTAGDLGRLSSYGEVTRDGDPRVVVTDYGLNDEVYSKHYKTKPKDFRFFRF